MNNLEDKKLIKQWLIQKNDLDITNFEFIDELFDEVLLFLNNNNLKLKYTEDCTKMRFINFLFKNTDTFVK